MKSNWRRNLEIVGAELFQRYRKRLLLPGIALDIREDYPGLSLMDVLVRVHAGRQIIREGHDFEALWAIRSGQWPPVRERRGECETRSETAGDRMSQLLVFLGGALFAGFCLLCLHAFWVSGAGLIAGLVLTVPAGLIGWHLGLQSLRRIRGSDPKPESRKLLGL